MAQDSGSRQLDDFVQNYFQDLRQDLLHVKARVEDLQGKLDQRLEHIAREPFLQAASGVGADAGRAEEVLRKLAEALQGFGAAADEEAVLEALSKFGSQMAERVLLLVRRGDRWVRFAEGRLDTSTSFASDAQTILKRAAESRAVVAEESARYPAHDEIHRVLGGEAQYCVAVPLLFGDSVPAVFYADTPESRTLNVPALEVLCQGARLAIRSLHLTDSKAQAAPQAEAARPQPAAPSFAPPAATQPTITQARVPSAPAPSGEDSIDFSRDILGRRQREWEAPARENTEASPFVQPSPVTLPPSETVVPSAAASNLGPLPGTPYAPTPQPAPVMPVEERTPPTPPPPPAEPSPVAAQTFQQATETPQASAPAPQPQAPPAAPSPAPVPPPAPALAQAAPSAAPQPSTLPLSPDEERQHADARRFARLLVSELKLYNEQAVVQGRRNRDIYTRLKQDIERSREMFNRRVPLGVTRRQDYFHEELVKLLAEGDIGSLGGEYPGPRSAST